MLYRENKHGTTQMINKIIF